MPVNVKKAAPYGRFAGRLWRLCAPCMLCGFILARFKRALRAAALAVFRKSPKRRDTFLLLRSKKRGICNNHSMILQKMHCKIIQNPMWAKKARVLIGDHLSCGDPPLFMRQKISKDPQFMRYKRFFMQIL